MNRAPLYALPVDDAPLSEWLRPLSGTLTTRNPDQFTATASEKAHGSGWLSKKLKGLQRKMRNARIDEASVGRMRRQGVPVLIMCSRLGVKPGTIYRVLSRLEARDA